MNQQQRVTYHDGYGDEVEAGSPEHVTTRDHDSNLEWLVVPNLSGLRLARDNAEAVCAALHVGDAAGWTLPRKNDVLSLIELLRNGPSLPPGSLPPFDPDIAYWTSTVRQRTDEAYVAMTLEAEPSYHSTFKHEPFSVLPVRWFNGKDPRPPENQEVWPQSDKTQADGEIDALRHLCELLLAQLTDEQVRNVWPNVGGPKFDEIVNPHPGEMDAWENGYFWTVQHMYQQLDKQSPGIAEAKRKEHRAADPWMVTIDRLEDLERRVPSIAEGQDATNALKVIWQEADAILAQAPEQQREWGRATVETMLRKAGLMAAEGDVSAA